MGLNVPPLLQPDAALGRRPEPVPVLQHVLVKLTVRQQAVGNPQVPALFLQLLEVLQVVDPILIVFKLNLALEVVLVYRGFQRLQVRFQILLNRFFNQPVVVALVKEEYQQASRDQPEGNPGWALPVHGVFGGDNQHGPSQFIIICLLRGAFYHSMASFSRCNES